MNAVTIRSDSPSYETVGGRKYTTCHVCDEVLNLMPDGRFTPGTVLYGNGFAIRAYCSVTCVDRMIRSAVEAMEDDDLDAAFPEQAFRPR